MSEAMKKKVMALVEAILAYVKAQLENFFKFDWEQDWFEKEEK